MPKYRVRIERVKYAEVEVDASSGLLARHTVMTQLEDYAEGRSGKPAVVDGWHDGGINVEAALEVKPK